MPTNRPPSFRKLMTFRLHMMARLSERISEEYYRTQFDLTLPQCRVIGITAGYGTVSFKQMAREAYLEKSYASRVVASLVERDILAKMDNPADSRSVLLVLTEHGHTIHGEMYAAAVKLNERLQEPFTKSEERDFLAFLETLEEQLHLVSRSLHDDPAPAAPQPARGNAPGTLTPGTIPLDRDVAVRLHAWLSRHLGME
ncbi:MAG TPA: MarR family winged helix-turn-helix transcriptional regulator [Sphingomonadaceae bacterium]|nr:MarR family winged helix-turn-helix transcriptional regulator [Sphingomonadaceae bacterium]